MFIAVVNSEIVVVACTQLCFTNSQIHDHNIHCVDLSIYGSPSLTYSKICSHVLFVKTNQSQFHQS